MSFAIVGFVLIYPLFLLIALFVASRFTKTTKAKLIVFAVWFLIPTWDVILGYPIYWYLCKYESGMKIYKTIDNVEGFYVGEKSKEYEPYEPYAGYRFIDYKEKETGKYYRSYWIDSNTSKLCIPIGDDAWVGQGKLYSAAFKQGKCIVKEEIREGDMSRWEEKTSTDEAYWQIYRKLLIPVLEIYKDKLVEIVDRSDNKILSQFFKIRWSGGWLWGFVSSIDAGNPAWITCLGNIQHPFDDTLQTTLKPKKGASHGNY